MNAPVADALQRDSFRLVANSVLEWEDASRALGVLISRFAMAAGLHDALFVVVDEGSGSVIWRIQGGDHEGARAPRERSTERTLDDFFGSETPDFDSERGVALWTWEVEGKRGVAIPVRTSGSLVATFFGAGESVGNEELAADFARFARLLVERLPADQNDAELGEPAR